MPSTKIL
jgi:hypothetical protein